VDERLALFGLCAVVEDAALTDAALVEGKCGGSLNRLDDGSRRLEIAAAFFASSLPAPASLEAPRALAACRCARVSWACVPPRAGGLPGKLHRAADQIAFDNPIDQAEAECFSGFDRFARHAHLDAFWTPTSRGRRCVPSAPGIIPRFTSG
jgi:hypothetical protein